MSNDSELDLIAILESEFQTIDEKARLRILCWAISWHQQHVDHRQFSAVEIVGAAVGAIDDKIIRGRVLRSVAVLLEAAPEPQTDRQIRQVATRALSFNAPRKRRRESRARTRSLCGKPGHDRRKCERYASVDIVIDTEEPPRRA